MSSISVMPPNSTGQNYNFLMLDQELRLPDNLVSCTLDPEYEFQDDQALRTATKDQENNTQMVTLTASKVQTQNTQEPRFNKAVDKV